MPMQEPIPPMDEPMPEIPDEGMDNNPDTTVNQEDGKSDSEIDSIFSKLDTEKQAAVIKYAKSMVESKDDEIAENACNSVMNDGEEKPSDKQDKKIRNKKVSINNPFKGKSFKN